MKQSDILPLQNGLHELCWVLSTLLSSNKSHTVIQKCAADDFKKKSRKNVILNIA